MDAAAQIVVDALASVSDGKAYWINIEQGPWLLTQAKDPTLGRVLHAVDATIGRMLAHEKADTGDGVQCLFCHALRTVDHTRAFTVMLVGPYALTSMVCEDCRRSAMAGPVELLTQASQLMLNALHKDHATVAMTRP